MDREIKVAGWKFTVLVRGADLVVEGTTATWFGGSNDPMDAGGTASGYPTKGHPELLACSLPMNYQGHDIPTRKALGGSPLPMMPFGLWSNGAPRPFGTNVIVTHSGKSLTIPVIDLGPARWAGDGIDLTKAAFTALGGNLRDGVLPVSYRVLDGAQYLE